MEMFCDTLKTQTKLKKVKATFQGNNYKCDEAKEFLEGIAFYTEQKKKRKDKEEGFEDRMRSTNQEEMFQQMLDYLEKKEKHQKMPVRKYYNNIFKEVLNDAIFQLKKAQDKATGEQAEQLQYHTGQIKFVADFIWQNLPAGEMTIIDENNEDD